MKEEVCNASIFLNPSLICKQHSHSEAHGIQTKVKLVQGIYLNLIF